MRACAHTKRSGQKSCSHSLTYDVTGEIARVAGTLKNEWATKGFVFTLPDMLIAATALRYKLALVTENRRDFIMPGLVLYALP